MLVTYESNNSGGRWWLSDDDWSALEAAGWDVDWGDIYFCRDKGSHSRDAVGCVDICDSSSTCHGHRRFASRSEAEAANYRWLGSLATSAKKCFASPREAIIEWERVTGKQASDDGCGCCGPPHMFKWGCTGFPCDCQNDHCESGSDLLPTIYDSEPITLRDAYAAARGVKR